MTDCPGAEAVEFLNENDFTNDILPWEPDWSKSKDFISDDIVRDERDDSFSEFLKEWDSRNQNDNNEISQGLEDAENDHNKECEEICKALKKTFPATMLIDEKKTLLIRALVYMCGKTSAFETLKNCMFLAVDVCEYYEQNQVFASGLNARLMKNLQWKSTGTTGDTFVAIKRFFLTLFNTRIQGFIESRRLEDPTLFTSDDLCDLKKFLDLYKSNPDF